MMPDRDERKSTATALALLLLVLGLWLLLIRQVFGAPAPALPTVGSIQPRQQYVYWLSECQSDHWMVPAKIIGDVTMGRTRTRRNRATVVVHHGPRRAVLTVYNLGQRVQDWRVYAFHGPVELARWMLADTTRCRGTMSYRLSEFAALPVVVRQWLADRLQCRWDVAGEVVHGVCIEPPLGGVLRQVYPPVMLD